MYVFLITSQAVDRSEVMYNRNDYYYYYYSNGMKVTVSEHRET